MTSRTPPAAPKGAPKGGPAKPRRAPKDRARNRPDVPMRTCIATREEHPQTALLRIVAVPGPTPEAVPIAWIEATGARGGGDRGAWVLPTAAAIGALEADPRRVARALHVPAVDTAGLLERARALADARVLDFLSLSARSGRLASGADAATAAVRGGEAAALLVANDASPGSIGDVKGARDLAVHVMPLDRTALGQRIGKGDRAVIALRHGGPGSELLLWLRRRAALTDGAPSSQRIDADGCAAAPSGLPPQPL